MVQTVIGAGMNIFLLISLKEKIDYIPSTAVWI